MTEKTSMPALPMPTLNEIRRATGGDPQAAAIPPGLGAQYRLERMTWRAAARPDEVAVVDRGHRLHTFSPHSPGVVSAMAIAARSRGWTEIEVTGTNAFRRSAYIEATAHGMQVRGYEPSPLDREAVARASDVVACTRNPMVRAYLTASSEPQRAAACRAYPGLEKAFAGEDDARRWIATQAGGSRKIEEAFISRFRENTAIALDKGKELPKVNDATRSSGVSR